MSGKCVYFSYSTKFFRHALLGVHIELESALSNRKDFNSGCKSFSILYVYVDFWMENYVIILFTCSVTRSQFRDYARTVIKLCQIYENYAKFQIEAILVSKRG